MEAPSLNHCTAREAPGGAILTILTSEVGGDHRGSRGRFPGCGDPSWVGSQGGQSESWEEPRFPESLSCLSQSRGACILEAAERRLLLPAARRIRADALPTSPWPPCVGILPPSPLGRGASLRGEPRGCPRPAPRAGCAPQAARLPGPASTCSPFPARGCALRPP